MALYTDVIIHIFTSLTVGFTIWRISKIKDKKFLLVLLFLSLTTGLFFDFDHLVDYFFVHGLNFDFNNIIKGGEFVPNKMYVPLHGFEYVFILGFLSLLIKNKTWKFLFYAMTLSMLIHLFTDMILFSVPIKDYFLTYRILNDFSLRP